jgi:hypothetical protein
MARKGRKKQREKTLKTKQGRRKEKQILHRAQCMLLEVELEHKRSKRIKTVFFDYFQIDLALSI